MSSIPRRLFHLAAAVCFGVAAHAAPSLHLPGAPWSIRLDPATLATEAVTADGRSVVISGPVAGSEAVADLRQSGQTARWLLAPSGVVVEVAVDGEGFHLALSNGRPGTLRWPVLEEAADLTAYSLPIAEGLWIPRDEERWRQFRLERSPVQVMADLSMPVVGLHFPSLAVAYILENPFDNEITWSPGKHGQRMVFTHRFQRNQPEGQHRVVVRFGGGSPVEAARLYREWSERHNRTVKFAGKVRALPDAGKLAGAAHIYLWANATMSIDDVRDWKGLVSALGGRGAPAPGRRLFELLDADAQREVRGAARAAFVTKWQKRTILPGLAEALRRHPELEAPVAAFLAPKGERGSAISARMLRTLRDAGLDRLWLGAPGKEIELARESPETVRLAREYGYLLGPYDSYHSIHSPDEKDTWPTAQFDRQLYETGAIVNEDGTKSLGFQRKGYHLSSLAAWPYMAKRVANILREAAFNSWFMDCDATGELFDNYSAQFPQTQRQDMEARLARMQWLSSSRRLVVGSEGGAWFAAGVIHFAHGMMTPLFGWGDAQLHDPKSKYFLGRYAPEAEPEIFFRKVELPEKYRALYFDPRYRLPLYQTAFHDAVVTTNHWSLPTDKFPALRASRELMELLYGVPPLYHLNRESAAGLLPGILRHYRLFSPLHKEICGLAMTGFEWLSEDHLVQRTRFGGQVEVTANFSGTERTVGADRLPPMSLLVRRSGSDGTTVYRPE